jgi:hypothetical protein
MKKKCRVHLEKDGPALFLRVELEGIDPSSAQENHMHSTCLFLPSIFEVWQDLEHQQYRLSTFSAKKV